MPGSLHSIASGLYRHEAEAGNRQHGFGMSGYKGFKCGSVEIGVRDKSVLVRVSGNLASLCWKELFLACENTSRLDLQVSVSCGLEVFDRIETHREEACAQSEKFKKKLRVRWIQEYAGGFTLYCGDRTSICFGRIYDQYAKSKLDHHRGCVRYEVQYHNKLAKRIAEGLTQVPSPMSRMGAHVQQFFHGRGVAPRWYIDDCVRNTDIGRRSDDLRTLEWLKTAVRPSVLRLMESGKGDEVFRALGLIVDE